MQPASIEYLSRQIRNHVALFFSGEALNLIDEGLVRFVSWEDAKTCSDRVLAIPVDLQLFTSKLEARTVAFGETSLTLWNSVPKPTDGEWKAWPCDETALWYQNSSGAIIPAWDLFGNLFSLLTFGEEASSERVDAHGRFAAEFSPRYEAGLLEVPAFNEAVAAIIGAISGLKNNGAPSFGIESLLRPVRIILSHDCDNLLGNDSWTQLIRLLRVGSPLLKLRLPKIDNLWWTIRNAVTPERFYFDNTLGMIDIERCFGFSSTFYLLNGTGGRFGARSGTQKIAELVKAIPDDFDIGVHYNYDTFLDSDRFREQIAELDQLGVNDLTVGRAHYLRFDPFKSFSFLSKHRIKTDESSGYASQIGYRNGIAGCFEAWDMQNQRNRDIIEVPLTIMDAVLIRQYGQAGPDRFSEMMHHLSRIGGGMTVVFHPGLFHNPEHKPMLGIYHAMLRSCRAIGAVSSTAGAMAEELRQVAR